MKTTLLTTAAIIVAGMSAHAQTPTLGTPPGFGGQPNTYGNVDSSQSTYTTTTVLEGGYWLDDLTLALDVTPRVSALSLNPPPVTTLGTGSYGVSTGLGPDGRLYWDFDLGAYSPSGILSLCNFTLSILNEANGQTSSFNPAAIGDNRGDGVTSFGNEESLDFTGPGSFFGSVGYNPDANDTYEFTLTASLAGSEVATDSIQVIAGTGYVPDATSTMGLMSASFVALGFISRRFRK